MGGSFTGRGGGAKVMAAPQQSWLAGSQCSLKRVPPRGKVVSAMQVLLVAFFSAFLTVRGQSCPEDNGYIPDNRQCDRYTECIDGVPYDKLCPDGLVFNENLFKSSFPCSYPSEVDCSDRPQLQPAQSTARCERAWGYFGSGDSSDCGTFWTCVDRREFQFTCPEGLAFSSQTYRCEWPDESPDCDTHSFLGFSCPALRDENQLLTVGHPRFASPRDCRKFFICVGSSPRLLTCELGTVFNEDTLNCDEPETVRGCETYYPREELTAIRERRERSRKAEERQQRDFQKRFALLNGN